MSGSANELNINSVYVVKERMQISVDEEIIPDRNGVESTVQGEIENSSIKDENKTVDNGEKDIANVRKEMETGVVKMKTSSIPRVHGNEEVSTTNAKYELETPIIKDGEETVIIDEKVKTVLIEVGVETLTKKVGVDTFTDKLGVKTYIAEVVAETPIAQRELQTFIIKEGMESPIIKKMMKSATSKEEMERPIVKEEIERLIDKEMESPTVKEEMEILSVKERMESPIDKEEMESVIDKQEMEIPIDIDGMESPAVNGGAEKKIISVSDTREISVIENESTSVLEQGVNISMVKETFFDELTEIPKKRARMDNTSIEEVKVPVDDIQSEDTFINKVAKPSVIEKEVEVLIKEEMDFNDKRNKPENSNSVLDDRKRDVQKPIKLKKNIAIIKELVSKTDTSKWSIINYEKPYTTVKLKWWSSEYKKIYKKFDKDFVWSINNIKRVQNPYLHAQYHLKMKQKISMHGKVKEHVVFHGTKRQNEDSICRNNFDFSKMGSNGFVYDKFGSGISFATSTTYAMDYPRQVFVDVRTMFVVKTLEVSRCPGQRSLVIPPEPDDMAASENVFVKFFDNEFYPEYIVHYE